MTHKTSDLQTNPCHTVRRRPEEGRARGAARRDIIFSLIAAVLVSSCAAAYTPAQLPATHPASPAAPEAPPPPPSHALGDESILPTLAADTPAQEAHAGHGAMHGGHR